MKGAATREHSQTLLFVGMYAISRLDSAGPVRILNLYRKVRDRVPTTLIAGTRAQRRWLILKYVLTGQLSTTRYVYVESSSSYATEIELLLMVLCKRAGIPVAIYLRDAYQLFPDYSDRTSLKVRMLDWLWRRSIQVYMLVADILLFPSEGLAQQFTFSHPYRLLPPAGASGRRPGSLDISQKVVLYVGACSPPNGVDLLLEAMKRVVQTYPEAECLIVTDRKASGHLRTVWADEPWVRFTSGSFDDLANLMQRTYVAAIPRRKHPYNSFALPIKLFDYMSFGKPVVVTDCAEPARYVHESNCGLVVEATAERLASGIVALFDNPDLARRLGTNGYQAIQARHSWRHRAEELLTILEACSAPRT
jgi:glycosyltransferase involved in cell wall biosynthesis